MQWREECVYNGRKEREMIAGSEWVYGVLCIFEYIRDWGRQIDRLESVYIIYGESFNVVSSSSFSFHCLSLYTCLRVFLWPFISCSRALSLFVQIKLVSSLCFLYSNYHYQTPVYISLLIYTTSVPFSLRLFTRNLRWLRTYFYLLFWIFFSELKFIIYIFIHEKKNLKIISGIMFFTHLNLCAKNQSDK